MRYSKGRMESGNFKKMPRLWSGLLEQLRYTQQLDNSAPHPPPCSPATTPTLTWAKRNAKEKNRTSTLMLSIDLVMSDSDNSSPMDTFEVICFEGLVASSLVPSIMTTVVQSHTSLNHYEQWWFVMKPAFKTSASISTNCKIQAIEQKFLFNRAQPARSHSSKIVKTHNRKTGIQRQPQTAMPISYRCGKG